jgi:hypothetical protein
LTDHSFDGLPAHLRSLAAIASELGEWRQSVVFIGGAIAPLLQTHSPLAKVRATKDVDAIVGLSTYGQYGTMNTAMRGLGFREDIAYGGHAHRWISPSGQIFDLVPAGEHLGATGNDWEQLAFAGAAEYELLPDLVMRHVTAPFFLILKWNAYCDRGRGDLRLSSDIEDLLALLASRPAIIDEVIGGPQRERGYLRKCAAAFLAHPDCDDALNAHLSTTLSPAMVIANVRQILRILAS